MKATTTPTTTTTTTTTTTITQFSTFIDRTFSGSFGPKKRRFFMVSGPSLQRVAKSIYYMSNGDILIDHITQQESCDMIKLEIGKSILANEIHWTQIQNTSLSKYIQPHPFNCPLHILLFSGKKKKGGITNTLIARPSFVGRQNQFNVLNQATNVPLFLFFFLKNLQI